MLRSLQLKPVYRSESDSLLDDFYVPVLRESVLYDRAVGFFSAAMLSYAAQGLTAFLQNEGKMRLVIGGELEADDERAIREGYDLRVVNERFGLKFIETVDRIDDALFHRRVEALSWLVACGRLDIKIAFRRRGMYHEKIGILRDANDDGVVFQGSANETAYALLPDFNFESINVFPTWHEHLRGHFTPYVEGFERLWADKAKDTRVLEFPDAARQKLIKISQNVTPPKVAAEIDLFHARELVEIAEGDAPIVPKLLGGRAFVMAEHQLLALRKWKANNFQGILALATGAGKTITAIYGAIRFFEASKRLALVIAVPYQNLADQWVDTLRQFNVIAHRCYGSRGQWHGQVSRSVEHYQSGAISFLCVVVVNRTLQTEDFQTLLQTLDGEHMLFVGDECHHHSSPSLHRALPKQAALRLGLSATPEHYIDTDATARLVDYYVKIVAEYTLADALRDKVITPYKYYITVVDLSDEETQEYHEISEKIAKLAVIRGGRETVETTADEQLKALLAQRSRILGTARSKIAALDRLLTREAAMPFTLFYCGDGSVEDTTTGEMERHVEQVSKLLADRSWLCSHFTSHESREARQRILDDFRLGNVDALVAIKCLDEGIDVPACRTAYLLASSRNPKQFIQRRGRILRRSEGKDFAVIHDFLVRLPPNSGGRADTERQLIRAELTRVAEFSKLALNSGEAVSILVPLLKEFDLAHVLV